MTSINELNWIVERATIRPAVIIDGELLYAECGIFQGRIPANMARRLRNQLPSTFGMGYEENGYVFQITLEKVGKGNYPVNISVIFSKLGA